MKHRESNSHESYYNVLNSYILVSSSSTLSSSLLLNLTFWNSWPLPSHLFYIPSFPCMVLNTLILIYTFQYSLLFTNIYSRKYYLSSFHPSIWRAKTIQNDLNGQSHTTNLTVNHSIPISISLYNTFCKYLWMINIFTWIKSHP